MNLIFGILAVIAGYIMYRDEWNHLYGFYVTPATGIFVSIVGFLVLLSGMFIKEKPAKNKIELFVICSECNDLYPEKHIEVMYCPKCNGKLEKLEIYLKENMENRGDIMRKIIEQEDKRGDGL